MKSVKPLIFIYMACVLFCICLLLMFIAYVCIATYVCVYLCVYAYVCISTYICVYPCVYVYHTCVLCCTVLQSSLQTLFDPPNSLRGGMSLFYFLKLAFLSFLFLIKFSGSDIS